MKKIIIFAQKNRMKELTYTQKISIMRVLLDIIYADNRVDYRESKLFYELAANLGLDEDDIESIKTKSAIISLMDIKELDQEQKVYFADLMDRTIKVDEEININEVAIYDIVIDYCKIPIPFTE